MLELEDVSKRYPSRQGLIVALSDVTLRVKAGEFVSIVGPSGCGKSTLLMIMAGLIRPSTGAVRFGGLPVQGPLTDVGIVFQKDVLFDWRTVLSNVMLQAEVRRMDRAASLEKAHALIQRVGLTGFENAHPWELSGGMRQRVAICRALLHDASLLLLDEPFGALDSLTRSQMNLDLQRLWATDRRTAVFITHDISEAIFLGDKVLVMSPRPGRIVAALTIELPRPRGLEVREDPVFVEYQREIREIFETMKVIG